MDKLEKCRLYTNEDFEEIKSWYSRRSMVVESNDLPKTGYIVPGIAAGFVMLTDCNSCILEPFIANPYTFAEDREEALKEILSKLCDAAKDMGYTRVFGFSTNLKMVWRAQKIGFKVIETNQLTVMKEFK